MTADEIKANVRFTERTNDAGDTIMTGRVEFGAECRISRLVKNAEEYAKDNIREQIVRKIFEDQRKVMHEACYELRACNPMDFSAWVIAMQKVLEAARFQEEVDA